MSHCGSVSQKSFLTCYQWGFGNSGFAFEGATGSSVRLNAEVRFLSTEKEEAASSKTSYGFDPAVSSPWDLSKLFSIVVLLGNVGLVETRHVSYHLHFWPLKGNNDAQRLDLPL